jgi:hypothetical protein
MASGFYGSLNPQKNEIRILTLLPGGNHVIPGTTGQPRAGDNTHSNTIAAEIHCELRTISLNDEPSYVALSYVWGIDTPSTEIFVNAKPFFVRMNLAAALRHLRQTDRSVNIWIDAICINQKNNQEKSQQVKFMARIYESCVEVLVWLGSAEDESDTAMEKLKDIGSKAIDAGMHDFRGTDIPKWFNTHQDERIQKLKASLGGLAEREGLDLFHPALIPLSKRAYWTRVWVLQEFSIPKTVKIQCGLKRLDITTFSVAFNFCAFARWTLSSRFAPEDFRDPKSKLRSISGTANAPSGAPNQLIGVRRRYHAETGERETLKSLLERTCMPGSSTIAQNATDPRDKIFGLLALAADSERLGIVPDYTKSTVETYIDVTRLLIAAGEISILSWCQQSNRRKGLPSWVPDFASDIKEAYGADKTTGALFSASKSSKFPGLVASPHGDFNLIGLSGVKVGTIADISSVWTPEQGSNWEWDDATRLIREVEVFCERSTLITDSQKALEASMRIPCADQQVSGTTKQRASSSIHLQYEKIKTVQKDGFSHEAAIYRNAMTFQRDRRPFLSSGGHIGLAPARVEVEDCICIMFGSPVPYVLRASTEGRFVLIGEAYVHGIMDGEWLDTDRTSFKFFIQ